MDAPAWPTRFGRERPEPTATDTPPTVPSRLRAATVRPRAIDRSAPHATLGPVPAARRATAAPAPAPRAFATTAAPLGDTVELRPQPAANPTLVSADTLTPPAGGRSIQLDDAWFQSQQSQQRSVQLDDSWFGPADSAPSIEVERASVQLDDAWFGPATRHGTEPGRSSVRLDAASFGPHTLDGDDDLWDDLPGAASSVAIRLAPWVAMGGAFLIAAGLSGVATLLVLGVLLGG